MTDDIYDMARISCEEIYKTSEIQAQLDWEAASMKEPRINHPDTNTNGTHLQGHIMATREQLEACLGPIKAEYGDKVCGLWTIEQDGVVATIYDWKEDSIPSHTYNWHIGGRRKNAIDLVERLTGMQASSEF